MKKRRIGEFRETSFGIRFTLRESVASDATDDFLSRFLEEAIEGNGLLCGGGTQGDTWEFYVSLASRGSPTEEHRTAVAAWVARQLEVRAYTLGDFFDGWNGPTEAPYTRPEVVRA